MSQFKIVFVLFLSTFSIAPYGDVINLLCSVPGKPGQGRVVLDTEQMAVIHKGKPGTIGLVAGDNIYYYLKYDKNIAAFRANLADGVLDIAASKSPPEVGYEHRKLACRRD